jgi:hypothetical protein
MGIAEIVGLALLAVAVLLVLLAYRRVRLVRAGGGIDVALRTRRVSDGRGWHIGVARYQGDQFVWYRVSSLRSGPDRVLDRGQLSVVERRDPTLPESYAVPPGSVVLRCRMAGRELELAMGRGTLPGFLSWLESAPPGRGVPRAS